MFSIKKAFLLGLAVCGCLNAAIAADNVVFKDKDVRITLITDGLARLEYNPEGNFIDEQSFVAVNRDYPEVKYTIKDTKNQVIITTDVMKIVYKKNGAFSKQNLEISSVKGVTPSFKWTPGMKQQGNLGGTFRTLDRMNGGGYGTPGTDDFEPVEMPDGLLATDGWTLIDDSDNFLFDNDPDWQWVKVRPQVEGAQDWYFMAYGHDYKKALKDFTVLSGQVPLPPRYAFGYWWSRYYSYSDADLRKLIKDFKSYDIPLDVLVIDMDWHNTDEGRGGWTGYTWDNRLFPDYRKMLKYLEDNDLKITLNLHPADGVHSYEAMYPEIAKDMGIDPASGKTIEWLASDKKLMNSMFNHIFNPYEKDGVNFWWLDWQQWPNDKAIENLSNTWWINYCFFSDMERKSEKRPMLYHRWGGLGNHRYQIGFSGDSYITWESLDYQPYYNSTASNVLYGYWSHDLGGHMNGTIIPEMYIRWMQFGALSPIMRTHSTKSAVLNKEPWVFNHKDMGTLVNTIRQRYEMAPYIYAMARKCTDEGISLCRPMYYDYPESQLAYDRKNDYMFGDNMLVSPITKPMDGFYSVQNVWLPEGNDWWELHTGTLLEGGKVVDRKFALDEFPIYVKGGSILPSYNENPHTLGNNSEAIMLTVYPGAESGSFAVYEDNGDDKNYKTQYATTPVSYRRDANLLNVSVGERKGSYADMPAARKYSLKVEGSAVPTSVKVNGKDAEWRFDGQELALFVELGEVPGSNGAAVVIEYPTTEQTLALSGEKGNMRRVGDAISDLRKVQPGLILSDEMGVLEGSALNITYNPEKAAEILKDFNTQYSNAEELIKKVNRNPEQNATFLRQAGL